MRMTACGIWVVCSLRDVLHMIWASIVRESMESRQQPSRAGWKMEGERKKEETRALQADKNTKERGVYYNDNTRDSRLKKKHEHVAMPWSQRQQNKKTSIYNTHDIRRNDNQPTTSAEDLTLASCRRAPVATHNSFLNKTLRWITLFVPDTQNWAQVTSPSHRILKSCQHICAALRRGQRFSFENRTRRQTEC